MYDNGQSINVNKLKEKIFYTCVCLCVGAGAGVGGGGVGEIKHYCSQSLNDPCMECSKETRLLPASEVINMNQYSTKIYSSL